MTPTTPAPPLDAQAVAALLIEIGRRMELGGESIFKVRAFYTAAENIQALPGPLAEYVAKVWNLNFSIVCAIAKLQRTVTSRHSNADDDRLCSVNLRNGFGQESCSQANNN